MIFCQQILLVFMQMYLSTSINLAQNILQEHLTNMITRNKACQVTCPICMCVCQDEIGRIQCAHSYCFSCILDWSKVTNSCPVCRQKITYIHKLKIQHQNLRYSKIQPQTILVPQKKSEDESEWQLIVDQNQAQLVLFSQNLFFNNMENVFTNQELSIFQQGSIQYNLIVTNMTMNE